MDFLVRAIFYILPPFSKLTYYLSFAERFLSALTNQDISLPNGSTITRDMEFHIAQSIDPVRAYLEV